MKYLWIFPLVLLLWIAAVLVAYNWDDASEGIPGSDAIIVFSGSSDRVTIGVDLLKSGAAKAMFISGVYKSTNLSHLIGDNDRELRIDLGYKADNTVANASEAKEWMVKNGYRSAILVTSDYHMARSYLLLKHALPNATITKYPVQSEGFTKLKITKWPGYLWFLMLENLKYLAVLSGAYP